MGNCQCQAAEAATVVIQHPEGRVQRVYWSLSASEVMASNPGHYVAVVVASITSRSENGSPVRQLKLLRPDETLHVGRVYRLICFEEVLKEFNSDNIHVNRSGMLIRQRTVREKKSTREKHGGHGGVGGSSPPDHSVLEAERQRQEDEERRRKREEEEIEELYQMARRLSSLSGQAGSSRRHGNWRPALQSIAEIGS